MGLCLLTDTWLCMLLRYLACLSLLYFTLGLPYLLECSSPVLEFLNAAGGLAYWL